MSKSDAVVLKQNSRIAWIDIAKTIAMTLIVFGHVDVGSYAQFFVYSFHVPVFIFLSGYCFSDKDRFTAFLKKKSLRIMVPYGFFGLFAIAVYLVLGKYISDEGTLSLTECLWGLLMGNAKTNKMAFNLHLWFLPCLFAMSIIFYGLKKLADLITEKLDVNSLYGAIGIFAVTLLVSRLILNYNITFYLPFSTEIAVRNMPFFSLGFLMKASGKINGDTDRNNKKQIAVLAAGFIVFSCILTFFAYKNIVYPHAFFKPNTFVVTYNRDYYGVPLYFYGAAFAGIAAVVCLAKLLPKFRALIYFGKNTLAVLVMQKFATMPARMIIEKLPQKQFVLIPAYLIFTAAVILMCLAADWIIRKYFPFIYGMPYENRRKK